MCDLQEQWAQLPAIQDYKTIFAQKETSVPSTVTEVEKHYTVFYTDTCNHNDYHQLNPVLDTMVTYFSTFLRTCHITRKFYLSSYPDLYKLYTKLNMLKSCIFHRNNQVTWIKCSYFQNTAYPIHKFPYKSFQTSNLSFQLVPTY